MCTDLHDTLTQYTDITVPGFCHSRGLAVGISLVSCSASVSRGKQLKTKIHFDQQLSQGSVSQQGVNILWSEASSSR